MATPREIRIKLRIDDAGIPIDLKKITDLIGNTFDKAGQNMAASFEKAAERVVASVANIGRATKSVSMLDGTKIVDRGASPSTGFTRTGAIIEPNRGASVAATGPAAITNYLSQGGFRPVSDRLTMDASGTKSTTQYRNAAGGIATLNNETQKLTTTVPRAQTYWERFKRSLATPLGSGSALGFVGDLAAKVYLIQAAFAGIDRLAIAPIKRLADQFIEATEASRKFELAIGGVTGLGRARQLNYGLVSASRNQPTDVAGLRQTGSTFAALPALAGKLNDPNAIAQIVGLNRTVARLGTLDPEQGQQGATTAIRELLEGGGGGDAFNSLRRRFGLSASTLSKAIGRTVDDIKADPALALKAVQKITDTLVPDSIVDQSGQLFSVKIQKIRDALDAAMARVGDSGAFDHLTQKVDGVAQQLFAALDSAKFQTQARKVSDAVSRAVDSIGSSVERFLRGATGARPDQPLVEVIGDALAAGVERLANIIDNLPAIADKIGQGVGVVAGEVTRLTDALTDIADKLNHPEKVVGSLGNYAIRRTGQYVLNSDVGGMTDAAGDTLSRLDAALFGGDKPAPVAKVIQSAPPVADSRRWGAFSDLVASLDGKDNGLPAFGPTLLAGISTAGRLNDLTRDQVDKLTEISGAGRGAFASSGEVTGRLQEQFLKAIDAFDNGLAEGERRLKAATDPQEAAQLRGLIQSTNDVRSKLISAYNTAGQTAADSLTESARDFRRGLADELANLPLAGPAAIAAASGRNAQIDAAMRKLEAIGVHGATTELSSWSVFQRQNFATSVSTRGLEDLQNQARTGTIAVGATPAQIDIAAAARPDDRVIQQRQADLIQNQQLPTQAALLNDANAALGAHPSDPLAIRDAAKAAEQYAALASRLKDLRDSAGEIAPAFRQFTDAARSSLEDGLGQAISRLIDGTGSLRDAFSSMAQSIVQEWSRMQAHLLVQGLIGDAGKQQSSGQSGGLGGLIGGILSAFAGGAASGAGGGTATAAMADGGILSRATLTLAGEAGPEAFVPLRGGRIPIGMSKSGEFFAHLPKGRTIPAQLHGVRAMADGGVVGSAWAGAYRGPTHITSDGGMFQPGLRSPDPALIAAKNGGNIYVIADMQQAVKLGFIRHKDTLVDILSADAAKGGKTARTFRGLR